MVDVVIAACDDAPTNRLEALQGPESFSEHGLRRAVIPKAELVL